MDYKTLKIFIFRALHLAARNGLVSVTRELLRQGASVSAVDSEGYTPALCCAPNSQVAQCLALILLNSKCSASGECGEWISFQSFNEVETEFAENISYPD